MTRRPYGLFIDEEACWGCRACEVACQQEREFQEGPFLWVWEDGPRLSGEEAHFQYRVTVCRHCDDPPCQRSCPEKAIWQREDGIVILDKEKCTGCGICEEACPYDAVKMDPKLGKASKCDMCFERVDHGLYPACADNICMAHCIYFGRPEEVSTEMEMKRKRRKRKEGL
jgi:Fe-S-cluster-containing dehydrogenase component